jgi:hypothetical protein
MKEFFRIVADNEIPTCPSRIGDLIPTARPCWNSAAIEDWQQSLNTLLMLLSQKCSAVGPY